MTDVEAVAPSDESLLQDVAAGDRAALRTIYERHAPWLRSRMLRRCPDREVVAEALQDTFVAVWRSAGAWDGRGEPAAWIWGIAVRRLIGVLRGRSRWLPVADWVATGGERTEASTGAEEEVLLRVAHGPLGPALDGLSPELRAVIQATVLDGLTMREASRLLGIPTGTVKTRLQRARVQLRGAIAP
jgi:RNA polymerase sigma-70 factor (ECF subfamily)